jgi:hypothetical protein
MVARNPDDFIQVNGALNLKPSFGPIPADQLIPWSMIALTNIVVANRILGLSWIVTILSTGWGIATWWILTGSDASRFLSKFHATPYWLYGNLPYLSPLNPGQPDAAKPTKRKRQKRSRRPKCMRTDF